MSRSVVLTVVLLVGSLACIGITRGWADDVGIVRARLIQHSARSYVLEADVTPQLAWVIQEPIFPDRFQVSKLAYTRQSGSVVVQSSATTTGEPLSTRDHILLPWARNGVALTVQWLDGSVYRGIFMRTLEGIEVPMRGLMPSARSLAEVGREQLTIGFRHGLSKGMHLILVAALAAMAPSRHLFKLLLFYTFGQAASLILADVGLPGFGLLFVEILGVLLAAMVSYAAIRNRDLQPYLPLVFGVGLLHGLAYAQVLPRLDLSPEQYIPALFMFNMAIDIGHFGAAAALILIAKCLRWRYWNRGVAYATGSLAIALLMLLFQEHVMTGKGFILPVGASQTATRLDLPVSPKTQAASNRPRGARTLTTPAMVYLSVAPYEVRQEILIQARAAVQILDVNDDGMGSIPIGSLEAVKNGILDAVQKANPISIDGQPAAPVLGRADFVTLGLSGVVPRDQPVPESLDCGIIGLTLVYETTNIAREVTIEWRLFSDTIQRVEATTTDPFSVATNILSPTDQVWRWQNRLSGYRLPVIEDVTVDEQKFPVASGVLFVLALVLFLVSMRRPFNRFGRLVLLSAVGLGFVLYPFFRLPLSMGGVPQLKPSAERTTTLLDGLLTNVYRSFEVRGEEAAYDRLARTVVGDQLEDIYLQNRRALEFKNRGGARAAVDGVDIIAIKSLRRAEGGGFTADAVWTVSGSVSHFGHMHYRRNQYHALVTFVRDGEVWKIRNIELIDEQRVL